MVINLFFSNNITDRGMAGPMSRILVVGDPRDMIACKSVVSRNGYPVDGIDDVYGFDDAVDRLHSGPEAYCGVISRNRIPRNFIGHSDEMPESLKEEMSTLNGARAEKLLDALRRRSGEIYTEDVIKRIGTPMGDMELTLRDAAEICTCHEHDADISGMCDHGSVNDYLIKGYADAIGSVCSGKGCEGCCNPEGLKELLMQRELKDGPLGPVLSAIAMGKGIPSVVITNRLEDYSEKLFPDSPSARIAVAISPGPYARADDGSLPDILKADAEEDPFGRALVQLCIMNGWDYRTDGQSVLSRSSPSR
jgi:hypothetical protein